MGNILLETHPCRVMVKDSPYSNYYETDGMSYRFVDHTGRIVEDFAGDAENAQTYQSSFKYFIDNISSHVPETQKRLRLKNKTHFVEYAVYENDWNNYRNERIQRFRKEHFEFKGRKIEEVVRIKPYDVPQGIIMKLT